MPITDHQHAERLEHFERARQIEDRLGAGRHHGDRRARERGQIARHIQRIAAMHAADATGREHADAGARRQRGSRRDRRRRVAATRKNYRQIRRAGLDEGVRFARQPFELLIRQADLRHAIEHRDRGRNGAGVARRLLQCPTDVEIVRPRQAMRDDRRFEREHRRAASDGSSNFVREMQIDGHDRMVATASIIMNNNVAARLDVRSGCSCDVCIETRIRSMESGRPHFIENARIITPPPRH